VRVGSEEPQVQINAGNPLADQSGVLSRRYRSIRPRPSPKRNSPGLFWRPRCNCRSPCRVCSVISNLTGWPVFCWPRVPDRP
jgi:hypothetical protein